MWNKMGKIVNRILIILLLALPVGLRAQIGFFPPFSDYPNLEFTVNLAALADAPTNYLPAGKGYYFMNHFAIPLGAFPGNQYSSTNEFDIAIDLGPNQNATGWIVQQEDDNTFTPVLDMGTPIYGYLFPFYSGPVVGPTHFFSQTVPLTADQAQHLAAGRWYVEVWIGSDAYFGRLTPTNIQSVGAQHLIAGPTYSLGLRSPFSRDEYDTVIAAGKYRPAAVRLDASSSIDAFYLPLDFYWSEGKQWKSTQPVVTRYFSTGTHQITLVAADPYSSGTNIIHLDVISLSEAVAELKATTLHYQVKKSLSLLMPLLRAEDAFNQNDTPAGVAQLKLFQSQAHRLGSPFNATAIFLAQQIIDAVPGKSVAGF